MSTFTNLFGALQVPAPAGLLPHAIISNLRATLAGASPTSSAPLSDHWPSKSPFTNFPRSPTMAALSLSPTVLTPRKLGR